MNRNNTRGKLDDLISEIVSVQRKIKEIALILNITYDQYKSALTTINRKVNNLNDQVFLDVNRIHLSNANANSSFANTSTTASVFHLNSSKISKTLELSIYNDSLASTGAVVVDEENAGVWGWSKDTWNRIKKKASNVWDFVTDKALSAIGTFNK